MYLVLPLIGQPGRADALDLLTNNAYLQNPSDDSIGLEVVRPVLSALSHLHARGFVHRNVKTENVLVEYREPAGNGTTYYARRRGWLRSPAMSV